MPNSRHPNSRPSYHIPTAANGCQKMVQINLDEIKQLANQNIGRDEFHNRFLHRLVAATGAEAGVTWNCSNQPFQAISRLSKGPAMRLPISEKDHIEILNRVHQQQRSAVVKTGEEGNEDQQSLIILAPIKGRHQELIELIVPAKSGRASDQELLSAVDLACGVASSRIETEVRIDAGSNSIAQSGQSIPLQFDVSQLSQYVHSIHNTIDRKLTCGNIANETRRLLDCDRVSVVLWYRGSFRIFAISGQPSVNRRSNTVKLLDQLARKVLKTESEFWYPDDEDIAPQIKKALDEYLTISATRSLVIHPLREKVAKLVEDPESNESKFNPVIGGIVYEHCNEQWDRTNVEKTLDFVTHHCGDALRNAKKHHDLFLYPVWNQLSKLRVLSAPRVLPKTILAGAALCLISLFLAFWQVPFYVSASGVLVPEERQWVFARSSGEIVSVDVDHGSTVSLGQALLTVADDRLEVEIATAEGRITVLKESKASLERRFDGQSSQPQNSEQSINSINVEIESLTSKIELLKAMEAKLTVTSPIAGQVITWDAKKKLTGRTVEPTQLLLEVANPDGPWQLELDVEDRRVGHLLRGLKNSENSLLLVKFTLAADPNKTYEGKVVEIGNAMHLNESNEQMIRVRVELDEEALALKQAKSGVSAKIYCGHNTSVGYLWLHDIPESLKRYVLFYFAR